MNYEYEDSSMNVLAVDYDDGTTLTGRYPVIHIHVRRSDADKPTLIVADIDHRDLEVATIMGIGVPIGPLQLSTYSAIRVWEGKIELGFDYSNSPGCQTDKQFDSVVSAIAWVAEKFGIDFTPTEWMKSMRVVDHPMGFKTLGVSPIKEYH